MNPQQLWQAALGELELLISKGNFTTWFKNTSISLIKEDEIIIAVPNGFTKEWLEKKYHQTILKALKSVTNNNVKRIVYKIETNNINPQTSFNQPIETNINFDHEPSMSHDQVIEPAAPPVNNNIKENNNSIGSGGQLNLNPKYSFSSFIVGKNNELAHAAALAVAKSPGRTYNPLFIYGGVGLGKTHLMHAIGHKILEDNPKAIILYVSSEKFTNDYISFIRAGRAKEFEQKYRSVDVLLIDDIQFLSDKERTQEGFFHTFNELHQQNKQVVISSDRPPKAIAALEQRLISRFEWGMIADISLPDLETRIAIIEAKAREKNFNFDSDICNYLASVINHNIRELEGVINRLIALSQLQNKKLSLEEVKQVTASITTNSQKKSLTPKQVITIVSEYFDISIEDIVSPCRKKSLTEPRQIIMYLIREELKSSYPTIGEALGGRDHTTVIHAYDKVSRNLKTDEKLRQDVTILKQKLYN